MSTMRQWMTEAAMLGEASKRLRTFHVHWGMKRQKSTLGHYVIEAPNEREARKEAKRYLDARFMGMPVWRIAWVRDVEEEAAAEKARAEYEANTRTDESDKGLNIVADYVIKDDKTYRTFVGDDKRWSMRETDGQVFPDYHSAEQKKAELQKQFPKRRFFTQMVKFHDD
jgi:hypothetical protein